jgi:anthranilate synthase/aminodeoxychorismate synthase-like glutamine amidotransferase
LILLIDNYDSFTYNVFQLLSVLGAEVEVRRNDQISIPEIREMKPRGVVVSPGPGYPSDAGISCDIFREIGTETPVLGVCLGHQCIGAAFGGRVERAPVLMHGKTSDVYHQSSGVFRGIPSPFSAVRYHSLTVARDSLPSCLEITAETKDGIIMGVRHREFPVEGVQFHPESVLTYEGPAMLKNFLESC